MGLRNVMMKRLLPLVLLAGAMSPFAFAAPPALPLDDRQALIETLLGQMTLAEKIGQLRLISIGGDMPRERIAEEIAAGRIGATFNSVTRADNRPMQDAALRSAWASRSSSPTTSFMATAPSSRSAWPWHPAGTSTPLR
jgi:beta-glucosidase